MVEAVLAVPRGAVFGGDQVWLVEEHTDDDGATTQRLRRRTVEVLRAERDRVLVQSGLAAGDVVCVSSMQAPVDGMRVRVREASLAREER